MTTTIGQILVNDALPEDLRDYTRTLSKDETDALLEIVAQRGGNLYSDISAKLVDLGRNASYEEGTTLKLSDLKPKFNKQDFIDHVNKQEQIILNSDYSDKEKQDALTELYSEVNDAIVKTTYDTALASENPFALQVKSRARGNPSQLSALLTTPSTYQDSRGNTIPLFIRRSYAEGLLPHEYWAATYGARLGVVSTKFSTRNAGYLGKLMSGAALNVAVTSDDCDTQYGIPVQTNDKDNIGSVLAQDTIGFPRGTVLTKSILDKISKNKIDEIQVRSPVACNDHRGVCSICSGRREDGKFPEIGTSVGVLATSALAEQIAQVALNQKHCIFTNTPVLLPDFTTKLIKDIKPGDYVMGCSIDGNMRPVTVLNYFDNGPRECYRTYFKYNGVRKAEEVYLDSTLDHNILSTRLVSNSLDEVNNGKARVLPVGTTSKNFYALHHTSFDDAGLKSEPLALLIGLVLGDGCYTKSVGGVHFSTNDDKLKDDIKDYLASVNLKLTKLDGHDYYHRVSQLNGNTSSSNNIKNYLVKSGMYDKYSYEKELPPDIDAWDNSSIANLIAGLIITDGSVYTDGNGKPGIALSSSSRKLLEQYRRILILRFGIHPASITVVGKPAKDREAPKAFRHHRNQYQTTITAWSDVQRFRDIVPLQGVKLDKLNEYVDGYSNDRHDIRGFKRQRQEYLGLLPTCDIEVDHEDHLFVLANGLVVSNSGKKQKGLTTYSGFDVLKNMATIPKVYPDAASIAKLDGEVTDIKEAPQGGHYVTINDDKHYVQQGYPVIVKIGDNVEAGDAISDGVLNPADVVKYKGIGEGRRYFSERLAQAYRDSNLGVNRRNIEVLSRGLVNHVTIDDDQAQGQHLPGDTVTYSSFAYGYRPRKDAAILNPDKAKGKYLEAPALHYTIGTRVTPSVIAKLNKHKISDIMVHDNPVGVSANMISVTKVPEYSSDWMARLGTSHLKTRLLEDVAKGSKSDYHSLNPMPAIARGTEFGIHKTKDSFTY